MGWMKKWWLGLALMVWVVIGLWFARGDLEFIGSMGQFAKANQYDQRMYLFGADYQIYNGLRAYTPPNSRILALVPDSYYYAKMYYFLYPRTIDTVGDPEGLGTEIAKGTYDYVFVFNPPEEYYWGEVRTAAWRDTYNWDNHIIYQELITGLGEEAVGSEAAFMATLTDNFGNVIYKVRGK
jgi:hypothetical protein